MLEFLCGNGRANIAARPRWVTRSLGRKQINTTDGNSQSNGTAESFVNTFKRDYVSGLDPSDETTLLTQLLEAFAHFNEVHPHPSVKVHSSKVPAASRLPGWSLQSRHGPTQRASDLSYPLCVEKTCSCEKSTVTRSWIMTRI